MQVKNRETGNREPGTGNREQETGNRKPETGNRKPETGNRKPETGNRKPETGNRKGGLEGEAGAEAEGERLLVRGRATVVRVDDDGLAADALQVGQVGHLAVLNGADLGERVFLVDAGDRLLVEDVEHVGVRL